MQAAFYVKQGPAREVLQVGAQPTPEPGPGEVRVHAVRIAILCREVGRVAVG